MRLREYSESVPKPMVKIGYRPILWHIMKYYAHFGHKDFILCLGWKADVIKRYFLDYDECLSNDFVLSSGGKQVDLLKRDIQDWNITFVDTGTSSNIGQRLKAVEQHLQGEETFLANYADGLTDLHLPDLTDFFRQRRTVATFLSVKPMHSFHAVKVDGGGLVHGIQPIHKTDAWMNGGYFIFKSEIFNYIRPGEELVEEPFRRLISQQALSTLRYGGFWACMDTFKEMQVLEEMHKQGNAPWEVWTHSNNGHDQNMESEDQDVWTGSNNGNGKNLELAYQLAG